MTPFGVGLTVALGMGIGVRIVSPGVGTQELVIGLLFWGAIVGFLVYLYQMALNGVRWPWNRP
jgi:hypothetical protein